MKFFQPLEVPTLGDTNLAWFDREWPYNLGQKRRFAPCFGDTLAARSGDLRTLHELLREKPLEGLEVDFSKVEAVAMYAGKSAPLWENCKSQEILIRYGNQWLVLQRHIDQNEVYEHYGRDWKNAADAIREGLPWATYVDLGYGGDFSEEVMGCHSAEGYRLVVFNETNEPLLEREPLRTQMSITKPCMVMRFNGDLTMRNVVGVLACWGFVQSRFWPILLERFPVFATFREYLIHEGFLWSNGGHPLHHAGVGVGQFPLGTDPPPPPPPPPPATDPLVLARAWLDKPKKLGGPTIDQKTFVALIIKGGGFVSHADLSTGGSFDWVDPRKGATNMVKRINGSIHGGELWSIIPEDNSGCRIVLNSDLVARS